MTKRINTTDFHDLPTEEYKRHTTKNWTKSPCGSNYGNDSTDPLEYYGQVETHRYSTHPWIKQAIESFNIQGKRALEIGFGMGTDHLLLHRQGALVYGIDLTWRNAEITRERLSLENRDINLINGDAEHLPFPDEAFDFIYSFGVIHHSPDTEKIIAEIYRVLKPGGRCWITVYHKNSVFFWWTTFFINYLLKGGLFKRNLRQQLSLIEYPNDNPNMVIKLYTRRQFENMFGEFQNRKSTIFHLIPEDIAYFGYFFKDTKIKRKKLNNIGKLFGWYVMVYCIK